MRPLVIQGNGGCKGRFSVFKTDKMFRKGGSNPWKNALKPLERGVRLLEKLTKCIGRTAQTSGRSD
jgi:hypothetical protein